MNNASEFLEKAIKSPGEFLGVNRFASLDLSVEFLCKTKSKANKQILITTVDGLYNHLTDEMPEKYKSDNPVFMCFTKLLGSSWRAETRNHLVELYFENYEKRLIDTFLQFLILSEEKESRYLVTERLFDYFGQEMDAMNDIERVVYCIHVLNVSYAYHNVEYDFNESDFTASVFKTILRLTATQNMAVNRIAIWALYWMTGSVKTTVPLIKIDPKLKNAICILLQNNYDLKTRLRLSVILIKSDKKLLPQINKSLTAKWAANIRNGTIKNGRPDKTVFRFAATVEPIFLEALHLKDQFWLYEVTIPYLGLTSGNKIISAIFDNLQLPGSIKINSAIVLAGLGLLTNAEIETYNIDKSEIFDEIIRINSEFCYHVMGKDTTGRTAWYFVLVEKDKKDLFLTHHQGDSYDLADYGTIIASGYGDTVPEDVKDMLREKYGFDNF